MKILIIQYKMLGDVLTSTVIAEQLKLIYPNASIHYLISQNAEALVMRHPAIDELIKVHSVEMDQVKGVISLSRKLKQQKYDLVIDAYGKNNSALLTSLSGGIKKIGYKKWFSPMSYDIAIKNKPDFKINFQGTALWSRLILTSSLTDTVNWNLKPKIYLSNLERTEGRRWLNEIGLNPDYAVTMVSVLGSEPAKTLPHSYMARIIDYVVKTTATQVLFNYIPSQEKEVKAIYNLCAPETKPFILIEEYAKNIRDFLKVLYHCKALIGNEGGAVNMAKALQIPTYSIFSPWIVKGAWNIKEDGNKHVGVHLSDFFPEKYRNVDYKNLKTNASNLYDSFTPDLMIPSLHRFLKSNY